MWQRRCYILGRLDRLRSVCPGETVCHQCTMVEFHDVASRSGRSAQASDSAGVVHLIALCVGGPMWPHVCVLCLRAGVCAHTSQGALSCFRFVMWFGSFVCAAVFFQASGRCGGRSLMMTAGQNLVDIEESVLYLGCAAYA